MQRTENDEPFIDIVIPSRNEARHIGEGLEALARQDYPSGKIQVFVVDGNSTDATADIVRSHGVNLILSGGGLASSRNLGIRAGKGQFVGFLDAHCIPEPGWVKQMIAAFSTNEIGGCQGSFNYQCESILSTRLMRHSLFQSDDRLWEHTVSGKRNAYPWVVTGNSMFRREAIEAAGYFSENIFRCEDADFAWKTVRSGYRLVFVPQARVVHIDHYGWLDYLKKHYNYGVGAAQLARAFDLHGPRKRTLQYDALNFSIERAALRVFYETGFWSEHWRIKAGVTHRGERHQFKPVAEKFRPIFSWTGKQSLRLSTNIVYWFPEPEQTVVVDECHRKRYVLEGSAHHMFLALHSGLSREDAVTQIVQQFKVDQELIEGDLDNFVGELLSERILEHASL